MLNRGIASYIRTNLNATFALSSCQLLQLIFTYSVLRLCTQSSKLIVFAFIISYYRREKKFKVEANAVHTIIPLVILGKEDTYHH